MFGAGAAVGDTVLLSGYTRTHTDPAYFLVCRLQSVFVCRLSYWKETNIVAALSAHSEPGQW